MTVEDVTLPDLPAAERNLQHAVLSKTSSVLQDRIEESVENVSSNTQNTRKESKSFHSDCVLMIDFLDEDERVDLEMKERFNLKLENIYNEQLEELDKKLAKKEAEMER